MLGKIMKVGLILRIGIYIIGLWSLYNGLTAAVYYCYSALTDRPGALLGSENYNATLFGYAVVPLVFALMCFGFAGGITRVLLGSLAHEAVNTSAAKAPVLKCCVKLLALYLIGFFAAPLVATIYELAAVKSGNRAFAEAQVTSDLIANGLGVGFALWLVFRTDRVIAMFLSERENA